MESQISQPSEREVMEIISILVNGKRAGSNGISVKMLKAGAGRLQESWAGLMREVWETERMPAEGLDPGPEWQNQKCGSLKTYLSIKEEINCGFTNQ